MSISLEFSSNIKRQLKPRLQVFLDKNPKKKKNWLLRDRLKKLCLSSCWHWWVGLTHLTTKRAAEILAIEVGRRNPNSVSEKIRRKPKKKEGLKENMTGVLTKSLVYKDFSLSWVFLKSHVFWVPHLIVLKLY